VRALPSDGVSRHLVQSFVAAALTLACLPAAACGRTVPSAEDVAVQWKMTPAAPIVGGETLAEFTVLDRATEPVRGARLRVEAHMAHPGMAPIVEPAVEQASGAYTVRLRFSMAGAWVLFVKGELADRRAIERRVGETTAQTQPTGRH
jgi:YtkA-like